VVSVADLEEGREWAVGDDIEADAVCHAGELDVETLAALTAEAALTFASPGFLTILAQAVGTPSVAVFGGFEDGRSFSGGARFAPHLAIDPVEPCACFRHDCPCDKRIDLAKAGKTLKAFVAANALRGAPQAPLFGGRPATRPTQKVEPADCDLAGLPTRYVNPGELERLIALVASVKPTVMVEIGCNSGRTAKAILRNVPGLARYVGIDVPPSYEFSKTVQRREAPTDPGALALDDPRFRLLLARRGTFDLTPEDLPRCDVVFIDGDHGAEAVRNDHALALALVRPGGIIIHHDDHDMGNVDVRAVLDALSTPARPIVHVAGTWLAFDRVPAK
jgi:predicted O-methyltransferase YrrM